MVLSDYDDMYKGLIAKRNSILVENNRLRVIGNTHKVQCNCNVLVCMDYVIRRIPKPSN